MADLLQVSPNERIDIPDFEHLIATGAVEERELLGALAGDEATVIDGFFYSIPTTDSLAINLGAALGRSPDAVPGQLISEGVASRTVDFSGLTTSVTYGVYVRFTLADGANANRRFWDASGTAEVSNLVPTRQVANWEAQAAETSPGAEWVRIYNVAWNGNFQGGTPSPIVDERNLLFEGHSGTPEHKNLTYTVDTVNDFKPNWGDGANDRNDDRSQYGIPDLQTFVQFVMRKVEEITTGDNLADYAAGTQRYWDDVPDSLDNKLSLDGTGAGKQLSTTEMESNEFFRVNGATTNYVLLDPDTAGPVSGSAFKDHRIDFLGMDVQIDALSTFTSSVDLLVSKANPTLNLADAFGTGEPKIHMYHNGAESTDFVDWEAAQSGALMIADIRAGDGTTNDGAFRFSSGVGADFIIDPEGNILAVPGIDVQGNDLLDTGGAATIGTATYEWLEIHGTTIYGDKILPTAAGAAETLGETGDPWNKVFTEAIFFEDNSTPIQLPSSQAVLAGHSQQRLVVARCHKTGGGTPAITGDHYNVSGINDNGVGSYTIDLDQAVDQNSSIHVTAEGTAAVICAAAFVTGTQIDVRTFSDAGSSTPVDNDFFVTIIGRPGTLQTNP